MGVFDFESSGDHVIENGANLCFSWLIKNTSLGDLCLFEMDVMTYW